MQETEIPTNLETRQVSMSIKFMATFLCSFAVLVGTVCGTYSSTMRTIEKYHTENVLMFQKSELNKVISENSADKRTTGNETEIKDLKKRMDAVEAKINK